MRELRERAEAILKITCLILAALVVYQLAGIVVRWNPFRGAAVPALPTLATDTNSPAGTGHGTNLLATNTVKGTNRPPQSTATNQAAAKTNADTNLPSQSVKALSGTNSMVLTNSATSGTNAGNDVVTPLGLKLGQTNAATETNGANLETNSLLPAKAATNVALSATSPGTNAAGQFEPAVTNTNAATNVIAVLDAKPGGTNAAAQTNTAARGTNILATATAAGTNTAPGAKKEKRSSQGGPPPEMAGMNFNPFGPPGKSSVELPPAVKARIAKITDSEILGQVMRPLPMALLGIAGEFAFLRSANGQTGLMKEGDSLDDIKLLRIGVNRVLIELNGQKQELMIFSGYGGDSLLQTNSTNENKTP